MINKKKSFSLKATYILLFFIPYFLLNKVMHDDAFSTDGELIYFGIMFAFPSLFISGMSGAFFEDSFGSAITRIKNLLIEYKIYILLFFIFTILSLIFGP